LSFFIVGEAHRQMQLAAITQPDYLKGKRMVIEPHMGERVRIVADNMRLSTLSRHHVENDRPGKFSSVASECDGDSGLVVEFSLPHANPLPGVAGLGRKSALQHEYACGQNTDPELHLDSS
jgi:hypothetical protein